MIKNKQQSLYIHIPFCSKKCNYCDFYSVGYTESLASEYITLLSKQISMLKGPFVSIFIGGGTPSILSIQHLSHLLHTLKQISSTVSEFTIESNPESLTKEKLILFADHGVDRISLGIQSFDNAQLQKLGRQHTVEDAFKAIKIIQQTGFTNIAIDLIFGLEGQTLTNWEKELQNAIALPITHLSTYSLSYEPKTPLYRAVEAGHIVPLSDEIVAQMYMYAMDYLPSQGLMHYEVSNFARKNFECKHNYQYWLNQEYVGLGPSAVSYIQGVRYQYDSNINTYIQNVQQGLAPISFKEELSLLQRAKETAALLIRTQRGLPFDLFEKLTGVPFFTLEIKELDELRDKGLVEYVYDEHNKYIGIRLTKYGFLYCDTISSSLL